MKKRLIAVFMTCAFMFTTLPIATGSYSYAAAPKRPAQVKALKVIAKTQSSVTIRWSKVKNAKGYVIYRYDYKAKKWKAIKKVSAKTLKYKNTKLKAGTKYAYKVRAYNSYKQKQYYNSKTRKWVTKKPKKSQWKGKKTRTVTKYVYGPASATVAATTKKKAATAATNTSNNAKSSANATTNNSARTSTSTNSNTVKDTAFKNSTMANKVLYIDKSYTGTNDLYYELQTSKEDVDSIKWSSSNTNVVSIQRSVMIGVMAKLTIKGKGTATITATNWDGQKKTATVTVKRATDANTSTGTVTGTFALSGSAPSKIDKSATKEVKVALPGSGFSVNWTSSNNDIVSVSSNGAGGAILRAENNFGQVSITGTLVVPSGVSYSGNKTVSFYIQNILYPTDSDGAYVLRIDEEWEDYLVGGVEVSSFVSAICSLPRDAKVKLDIKNMNSGLPDYYLYGRDFIFKDHEVLTSSPNKVHIGSDNFVHFYDTGTAYVVIDGKSYVFILSGRNDAFCNYRDFVNQLASTVSGANNFERAENAAKCVASSSNFRYGTNGNPVKLHRDGSGDCVAGASMAKDIFIAMGFEAGVYNAAEYGHLQTSNSSSHQNVYVVIDGNKYWANCTPGTDDGILHAW